MYSYLPTKIFVTQLLAVDVLNSRHFKIFFSPLYAFFLHLIGPQIARLQWKMGNFNTPTFVTTTFHAFTPHFFLKKSDCLILIEFTHLEFSDNFFFISQNGRRLFFSTKEFCVLCFCLKLILRVVVSKSIQARKKKSKWDNFLHMYVKYKNSLLFIWNYFYIQILPTTN